MGIINTEEGFLSHDGPNLEDSYANDAIIVVAPSVGDNVITMYNVQRFLEKGEYVSSESIRKVPPFPRFHVAIAVEAAGSGDHPYDQRTSDAIPLHRRPHHPLAAGVAARGLRDGGNPVVAVSRMGVSEPRGFVQ